MWSPTRLGPYVRYGAQQVSDRYSQWPVSPWYQWPHDMGSINRNPADMRDISPIRRGALTSAAGEHISQRGGCRSRNGRRQELLRFILNTNNYSIMRYKLFYITFVVSVSWPNIIHIEASTGLIGTVKLQPWLFLAAQLCNRCGHCFGYPKLLGLQLNKISIVYLRTNKCWPINIFFYRS